MFVCLFVCFWWLSCLYEYSIIDREWLDELWFVFGTNTTQTCLLQKFRRWRIFRFFFCVCSAAVLFEDFWKLIETKFVLFLSLSFCFDLFWRSIVFDVRKMVRYIKQKIVNPAKTCKAIGANLRVSFKVRHPCRREKKKRRILFLFNLICF